MRNPQAVMEAGVRGPEETGVRSSPRRDRGKKQDPGRDREKKQDPERPG